MKKLAFVVLILFVMAFLVGCTTKIQPESQKSMSCVLSYGNGEKLVFQVAEYQRISSGWIVVTSQDGTEYATNERNVLLIRTGEEHE